MIKRDYFFSSRSLANRATLREELRRVVDHALKRVDFGITCGRRSYQEQERLIGSAFSKIKDPARSRHVLVDAGGNPVYDGVVFDDMKLPMSEAFDFIPTPFLGWNHPRVKYQFAFYAGIFVGVATELGIELEWGGDFDGDNDPDDFDFPHIQLSRKEGA